MSDKGELYFEMPPIIGDPSLPFKRAVGLVSAHFGNEGEKMDIGKMLNHGGQVVLRLPMPDSLLFHAAYESEQKFPVANLIVRTGRDPERPFSDLAIIELRTVQVILFQEYHGDILVGLEYRKLHVIRGSFFLLVKGINAYRKIRRTLNNLPGF
jgi:hypothetical protein